MEETVVHTAVVANEHGIHARPSHAIVSAACDYQSRIELRCDGRTADARSILAVMTLGAAQGASIEVSATGPDAAAAVAHMVLVLEAAEGQAGQVRPE
jgi:phosphotransferase system HPr (HPr) family protein